MMKKSIAVTLSLVMALSLTGCGGKDKEVTKSTYEKCQSNYYGEVKLADYDKFVVYSEEFNISDDEVESQVNQALENFKTYEDTDFTKVQEDSVVNISYVGTIKVDGKDFEFEGGTAQNQDLEINNSGYIPGFAEGLTGAELGKTVTLNLTFPDTYGGSTKDADGNSITLAGMDVKFDVTINKIQKAVLPELTDDFVKENLNALYGVTNIEELKNYITTQNRISNSLTTSAMDDYVELCDVKVNEDNLKKEIDSSLENLSTSLEQYSMSMEDYLSQYASGKTEEEFKEELNSQYESMFKTYAVICSIVEQSGTVLTKEKYDEMFSQFAQRSGYTNNDTFAQAYQTNYGVAAEESLPIQFTYQDAVTILLSKATVNDGERPTEEATTSAE